MSSLYYMMLIATPQLRATLPIFWTCLLEETSRQSSGIQPHAQLRMSGGQDMRTVPTRILLEVTSRMHHRPPLALRDARLGCDSAAAGKLVMMTFICSCRNNNQPTDIYPLGTFEAGPSTMPAGSGLSAAHPAS